MSILDEIDQANAAIKALQEATAKGVAQVRQEVADGIQRLEAAADDLRRELANAQARTFTLKLASGRDVTVSERDALQLFAAVPIGLKRQSARLELHSGQTEEFNYTDLEHLAEAIVAANMRVQTP